jgi:hypothetical protein
VTDGHDALADELTARLGSQHMLIDLDLTAPHGQDWTGRFRGR